MLCHPHARYRTFIRAEYEQVTAARPGGQDHTFGYTKTHFAGLQVGHHHGVTTDQVCRFIGGFDTGKYSADFATDVERELQ